MWLEVHVDMNNKNLIASMAYIRNVDNPIVVFCNFIAYCLQKAPNKSLRVDELSQAILQNFGLNLPAPVMNTAIRIMKNNHQVNILKYGAGYEIVDSKFDIDKFDAQTEQLIEREKSIINSLIAFLKREYSINWTFDQARENLTHYLIDAENAYGLFVNGSYSDNFGQIKNDNLVGRFVTNLCKEKGIDYDYLIDIVKGIMIYLGVYETGDYNQNKNQKFKGTKFFLDTKIVLRILGYSSEAQVQAANEIFNMLRKEYQATPAVFQHTISEVDYAFKEAEQALKDNKPIFDYELRFYAQSHNCIDEDFVIARQDLAEKLKEIGFCIEPQVNWNKEEVRKYNIDWDKIVEYIYSRHTNWKYQAILNDISAINQINILRKSDYSVKYGGPNRLPIFITSNISLVKCISSYIKESEDLSFINLPIISDEVLMCRLWLPLANRLQNWPRLILSRDAYAAQQSDVSFYSRLRDSIKVVGEQNRINLNGLNSYRQEKLETFIIKNSSGKTDSITPELVAASVDEMIKMETMGKDRVIEGKEQIIEDQLRKIEEKDREQQSTGRLLIKTKSESTNTFWGIFSFYAILGRFWWLICALLLISIDVAFKFANFNLIYISALFFLFKIVDRIANRHLDKIKDYFMLKANNAYRSHISKRLDKDADLKKYQDEIMEYCITNLCWFEKRILIQQDSNGTYLLKQ